MTRLWSTLQSWLPSRRAGDLLDGRLLTNVASAAERFRRVTDAALAQAVDVAESREPTTAATSTLGRFVVAVERTLGWTPFDVQLQAAVQMASGRAVEMQTGEGKTLAVAAAAALWASAGRRVHVATVNRYLAERDYCRLQPVFVRLGLTVGAIVDGQSPEAKRTAYANQIVYGTGYEFGFDYLREQLRLLHARPQRLGDRFLQLHEAEQSPLQPLLDGVIVDELDSVLLDEACVPLILSESQNASGDDPALTAMAEETALSLRLGEHFSFDVRGRSIQILPTGYEVVDRAFPKARASALRRPWRLYVEQALLAHRVLQREVDYLVADGKVWLVDVATGRVFADRRWPEGLHQAVEFKERVAFSPASSGAARITRQRFFRLYRRLTGTSGTLCEARDELRRTFGFGVAVVPPRLPSLRTELATRYFVDDAARLRAAVAEANEQRRLGRPVLVGCRTIAAGRRASQAFASAGIPHLVLDGTQSQDEAEVIATAGRAGVVTLATNLAGRGTDILLDDAARRAGGLHVVGIERHDSSRIDRQLLGRAGRQGDPGSGRFFLAADDRLIRSSPELVRRMSAAARADGEIPIDFGPAVAACRRAIEDEAARRRRLNATLDGRFDDLLDPASKPA